MVGINLLLNLVLIWPMGTAGLALSTALCAAGQGAVLLVILIRRYNLRITEDLGPSICKTIIATVVMGFGGWWLMRVLAGVLVT